MKTPDYKKIYSDIITRKYPEKRERCSYYLLKKELNSMDIIKLNDIIFENDDRQKHTPHRSYDMNTILEILNYQKKNNLNNSQIALHFKISRNTITKWKRDIRAY